MCEHRPESELCTSQCIGLRPSLSLAAELCGHGVRHDGERPGGSATKGLAEHGSAMIHEVAISG